MKMIRTGKYPVIYPILFALNPILLPLSANISDVSLDQAFPMILVLPLIAIVLFFVINRYLKDANRSGYITFLLFIWFFHYNNYRELILNLTRLDFHFNVHLVLVPLWTIFFLFLGSSWIWKRISNPDRITLLLNLAIGSVIIFSFIRISSDLLPRYRKPGYENIVDVSNIDTNLRNLPDIYYIVLDGYSGEEVLDEIYGYDNSTFLGFLAQHGFKIGKNSTSNYMQTALSISSSLNFDYLEELSSTALDRGQLIGLIKNSRIRQILEYLGYRTIAFSSSYQPTDLSDADIYFESDDIKNFRNLDSLLLINSIAIIGIENRWFEIPIMRYKSQQQNILFIFEKLGEIPKMEGPNFVFAHIIVPHPPFIFDEHGAIDPGQYYILMDGNKFSIPRKDYIDGYTRQLTYTNKLVTNAIGKILRDSKTPPIIIIQADHGPGAYLNFDDETQTCHHERFSILNAYYIPNSNITIPDDITPVNSFRIILNDYFNQELDLLDNASFYSTWNNPYHFMDVTEKIRYSCGN